MEDDTTLLRLWAGERSEKAFSELVARYAGMVFTAALRRLKGCRPLAEEAAQNVFTLLAARASSLADHPCLAAWLHRAALWQASTMSRNEAVRARKLGELAIAMTDESRDPGPSPPLLDELDVALEKLAASDRRVLFLRFFERCNFRDIAGRLGLSEAAAQKQSTRALQRLSTLLQRRGTTACAATLSAVLPAAFTGHAPAALVERLSCSAVSAACALSKSSALIQTLALMAYGKKISLTVAGLLLMLAMLGGSYFLGRQQALAAIPLPSGTETPAGATTFFARKSALLPQDTVSGGKPVQRRISIRQAIANASRSVTFVTDASSIEPANPPFPLRELLPEEFGEALQILPEFRTHPDIWDSAAWFVFSSVAARDPVRAAGLIDQDDFLKDGRLPATALKSILIHWAEKDLDAAATWMYSLGPRGEGAGLITLGELTGRLLLKNPEAALSAIDSWSGRTATYHAFSRALTDESGRDAVLTVLNDAGERRWLEIAGTAPGDPAWLSGHFLPWLFNREWHDPAQIPELCEQIINRGVNNPVKFAAVCESLGAITSPDLALAVTDELLPVFRRLSPGKREAFLDRITVPELRNRITQGLQELQP